MKTDGLWEAATGSRSRSSLPLLQKLFPNLSLTFIPDLFFHYFFILFFVLLPIIFRTCMVWSSAWIISSGLLIMNVSWILWEPRSELLAETHQLNNRVSQAFD